MATQPEKSNVSMRYARWSLFRQIAQAEGLNATQLLRDWADAFLAERGVDLEREGIDTSALAARPQPMAGARKR